MRSLCCHVRLFLLWQLLFFLFTVQTLFFFLLHFPSNDVLTIYANGKIKMCSYNI